MICNSFARIDMRARIFGSDPEPIPRVYPGFLSLEDKSRIKKIFLCESLRTLRLCGCNLFFFNRRGAEAQSTQRFAEIRRERKNIFVLVFAVATSIWVCRFAVPVPDFSDL
uniref:Uncharacterized protein n=1 Tax=Candidatus Kentrum sp. DK TaxID=2126562 RepID=A0A450SET8_9GAMM|nr:MAG: hypothetical protein BECKDK2373C_GA0170839_103133 [Candidatus Kentron sp. DK]